MIKEPETYEEGMGVADTAALARHLGLSRWTISRVLNGHPGVKGETRERVMRAVVELGFEPNRMARGLRGAPSGLIGVCFQQLDAPILARKTAVLQRLIRAAGYRGILELTDGDGNLEATVIRHFLSIRVDGLVLVGSSLMPEDPVVGILEQGRVPVVCVDPIHRLPFASVHLDRAAAMEKVVGHLHGMGHRRFALLGMASDNLYGTTRFRGLREAAMRRGMDFERDFISLSLNGYDLQEYNYGRALGQQVLEIPVESRPTALIALNDRIAIAVARVLLEAGVQIPEECSIVGFDNLDVSAWVRPSLTTIDQQLPLLMTAAKDLLVAQLTGEEPARNRSVTVQPALVQRDSTANLSR
jgi:DNA-binding LacI/PurR family transcriptional regulator